MKKEAGKCFWVVTINYFLAFSWSIIEIKVYFFLLVDKLFVKIAMVFHYGNIDFI